MKTSFLEKILIAGSVFLVGALLYEYASNPKPKPTPKPKKKKIKSRR